MREVNRRHLLRCAAATGAVAVVTRGIATASAAERRTLLLYSGQEAKTTSSLVAGFEKATGAKVNVNRGKSRQLARQIIAEGAFSPADVFLSEETAPVISLSENGLLGRIDPFTLKSVPAEFVAGDESWIGISARCRVVAYNIAMVDESELPTSVLDFATPAWDGEIGYVPTSGAFQEQIVAIVRMKGRTAALDWLTGLRKYGRPFVDNMSALRAVEHGEIATALINNHCWFALLAERGRPDLASALHYIDGKDAGALVTISAAAVLGASDKNDLAQAFLAFMVSHQGQQMIANAMAEYPLRPGVESPFALKPWSELDPPPLSPRDLGDAADAIALERQVGLA
jgi:iron(III) transport system substrate-binding protein